MEPGNWRGGALVAAFVVGAAGAATAHSGAAGVVKQRMDAMSEMARHMKSVGQMLKGEAELDTDQVAEAAHSLSEHARNMPGLFPEGSHAPVSEARMLVWEDWDGFVDESNDLHDAARSLREAAATGERQAIASAFREVGQSCGGCHEAFRLKK